MNILKSKLKEFKHELDDTAINVIEVVINDYLTRGI